MTGKKLVENAQDVSGNLSENQIAAVDTRAAVAVLSLQKGEIITFDSDPKKVSKIVDVLGNNVRMLYGFRVSAKDEQPTDQTEGCQLSAVTIGRKVVNAKAGVNITPRTVATEAGADASVHLAFDDVQDLTVGEIPAYVAGKYFRVIDVKQAPSLLKNGEARTQGEDKTPVLVDVVALEVL